MLGDLHLLIGCHGSLVSVNILYMLYDAANFLNNNFVILSLDVEIKFPEGKLNFDNYLGCGQQPGEESLPEDGSVSAG